MVREGGDIDEYKKLLTAQLQATDKLEYQSTKIQAKKA